jgi:hypothetical protein
MIRPSIGSDRLPVVAMLKRFHAASGFSFAFSAVHAEAQFKAHHAGGDRLCLVLDIQDRPAGVLMAGIVPHPFAPIRMASELCWWIDPEHRGRPACAMVIAYEAWAKAKGCTLISLAGLGSDPAPAAFYSRHGYTPAETHFCKTL